MRRGSLIVFVGCVCLTAATAQAQNPSRRSEIRRARVHFETGTSAFEEGDYDLAIREFQAAHAITGLPDLMFNIYSAAERAGRLEEAADALTEYLEGARLRRRQRRALEARLGRLQQRVEEARAQAPPEPPSPSTSELPAEPASAEPSTDADGEPPLETVPASADASSQSSSGVHPAGVASLVVAGALLSSFGVFATLSELEDVSLAGSCGRDTDASCAPSSPALQRLEAFNLLADISWIAGASAALAGVVLLLVLPPEGSSADQGPADADASGEGLTVRLTPWVTPDGAGGGAVGRW